MKMRLIFFTLVFLFLVQNNGRSQVSSDGWAATDALGRKLAMPGKYSTKRAGKQVAIFYWTWHTERQADYAKVCNITETLKKYPEAANQYNHPAWGVEHQPCFWDEPLFGYYRTTDPWVLRKHAEMLADAGVDAVFFDCTNGSFLWKTSYDVLMETWDKARRDGVKVPKIAFMLPFGPIPEAAVSIKNLYRDIYARKRFPDLWFRWEGKPIIMAYPETVASDDDAINKEIREFFTFRPGQPDYVNGPANNKQWAWMEVYPQNKYVTRPDGTCEQVVVSTAQNTCDANGGHCYAFNSEGAYGRSYTKQKGQRKEPDAYLYGYNFQEQWDRAIEIDPDLVFVTGWNEFIAGKHLNWPPNNPHQPFSFPDQYDWDRSRDIEPVKAWGDRGDVYYLQLVQNIRRFKGMDGVQPVSGKQSFKIGAFAGWENVLPDFKHYKGNVMVRDHKGHADKYYTNNSGRNDIVGAKVARDNRYLYFYVETAEAITSPAGAKNWMCLFIDADRDKSSGWQGYDFVLNRISPDGKKAVLEKNNGNIWDWQKVANLEYAVNGNRMEIKIKKSLLGIKGDEVDIEFKWSDNMQEEGNIMDFYVNGDVAPSGRFNFVYSVK